MNPARPRPTPPAPDEPAAALLIRAWPCRSDGGLCARLISVDDCAPGPGTVLAGRRAIDAAVRAWLDRHQQDPAPGHHDPPPPP
jgi:hypothetical protein